MHRRQVSFAGRLWLLLAVALAIPARADDAEGLRLFETKIRPALAEHCDRCHSAKGAKPKGGLRLDSRDAARKGGNSGPAIVPGKPEQSLLLEVIGRAGDAEPMPPDKELATSVVADFRRWIELGAPDPRDAPTAETWWSLKPIAHPHVPVSTSWARTPIDAFLLAKMREKGLTPSPEADRRTLIRRVTFDLIGLPPTPEEVEAFLADSSPDAYERLVDRLLASPHHGERWARHWLDVARYGDTHGYDKDKPRPNAWPYRDYVIRAFNEDKPYARFVREQVAGDVLYPGTRDGIEALGFMAAGPWDFIGHAEVSETKIDGQIARLLDRDDMVSNTLNTFASLTVQCARCHDHKFDPVSQEDYYSLQAVFAALDRADKTYDADPAVARRRVELATRRSAVAREADRILSKAKARGGVPLAMLDGFIAQEAGFPAGTAKSPAFGYHSGLSATRETVKWVQIDLGRPVAITRVVLHAPDDDFNNIGPGFGFPARFKVEASDDPELRQPVTIADKTGEDFANPGLSSVAFDFGRPARYVRVTATKLAPRLNDYNFALAEVEVLDGAGTNLALGAGVSALDTIEAPPRWRAANLVDGSYPTRPSDLPTLKARRQAMAREALEPNDRRDFDAAALSLADLDRESAALPPLRQVYAGTVHNGSGAFQGTGSVGGRPRVIRVLKRGDVRTSGAVVGPGTAPVVEGVPSRFDIPADAPEGARRAALANWLTDARHPLTWRSIVNRVWQYHFGQGLVDSPSDFGRMGRTPSHPELLDWLASEFRDGGQSIKRLHRLIVTSATYRQSSAGDDAKAAIDGDNMFLWRMNRRRLEAEAVRDSVLSVSGRLDRAIGGPGFRDFVVEHPEHSPHYEYRLANPEDPSTHRRSIYRFIVRSQPQPFLTALDCADPSAGVDKRNESITALQALALLNDRLMVAMAGHLAERLETTPGGMPERIDRGFRLAMGRPPSNHERDALVAHARRFGLPNACRLLFNLNEFVFVD